MKALLTTIVDNVNYGTYLQAYATVKLLEERGWEVEVLNYIRPHLNYRKILSEVRQNGIVSWMKGLVGVSLDKYMRHNLKKFLESKVSFTREFTDWSRFRERLPEYDLYLVGSDQVWNTAHNHGIDEVFYFGGIEGNKRSYASSVGLESFDKKDYKKIKSLLSGFSKLSVRESFGVSALKELGFTNVEQVLDPTLMITGDEWKEISNSKWKKKEPYLLVYSVEVNRDQDVIAIAHKIAEERGLKVYMVSPYLKIKKRLEVDKLYSLADTDLFLRLFSQADYAVVSSFHGTAFAINFGCQFVTVSPDKFSTRVESLLKLLNIEDRYVKSLESLPSAEIDYVKIHRKLTYEKSKSSNIINDLIYF